MTDQQPEPDGILAFAHSELSRPFWAALAEGRLVLPKCGGCGSVYFYPRRWCPQCWSEDLGWVDSAGTGTVYALTEMHLPFQGISKEELPVTAMLVDLDDGVRIPARLDEGSVGVAIGDRVRIAFASDPAHVLPKFVRA